MKFRLLEEPSDVPVIATGSAIRDLQRLRRAYGGQNWRKLSGIAKVEMASGRIRLTEVHWYECTESGGA